MLLLDDSVIRVLNGKGHTVGTGFIVADCLAVTCAHVVNAAGSAPGGAISISFFKDNTKLEAQVLVEPWSPNEADDVAFLRLPPMPDYARPLNLGASAQARLHKYVSLGFPKTTGQAKARRPTGSINGQVPSEGRRDWLELTGEEMDYGMSGAPINDLELGWIVGMVTSHSDITYTRIIYATTAETIQFYLSQLEPGKVEQAAEAKEIKVEPLLPPLPPQGVLPEPGQLPEGSRMPFLHNAVFTGREAELKMLADALLYAGEPGRVGITQPVAASGLGGIGKTQLAVEFCYRYGQWFEGIHWISAGNVNELDAEIAACGAAMALPYWPEKQADQVAITLRAWAKSTRRLVVLDNLEEPEALRNWLQRLANIPLLITSRRQNWPRELGVAIYPLDVLKREESRALLRRLAPRFEPVADDEVDQIADRLGDLPLAIDLAGRYLDECSSCSAAEYLAELNQAQELNKVHSVLTHPSQTDWTSTSPTGHIPSLLDTFSLSWKRLAENDKPDQLARLIFKAAGYCATNVPIPASLLWETIREEGQQRPWFDRAAKRLVDLGLLSFSERGYLMHPLLSEYADGLPDHQYAILTKLTNALAALSEEAVQNGQPILILPLLPHLEEAAPMAEKAGIQGAGALWDSLGIQKSHAADFTSARTYFERALIIDKHDYGDEHPRVARDLNDLGTVLRERGDYKGAQAYFERALLLGEKVYGPNHPDVARFLNNLGMVLQDLGDYIGAQTYMERALHIDEQVFGPDHPNVARELNNLGAGLQHLGNDKGAQSYFERALHIYEKGYEPNHPNIARELNNLGMVLQDLGDDKGAQAYFERALHIFEQAYESDHPDVAKCLSNLGMVLRDLRDYKGAQAYFERALHIDEQIYGPDHPEVARDVNNLGAVLASLKNYPGAISYLKRALNIYQGFLPKDHPTIKKVRANLMTASRGNSFRGNIRRR